VDDLKYRLDRELERLPVRPIDPQVLVAVAERPRHRVLVVAVSLLLGLAGCLLVVRAFGAGDGGYPRAAQRGSITVDLSEEAGVPTGILNFHGSIRTYIGRGFCKTQADCPLATDDPRPTDYIIVPRHTSLSFTGDLEPVEARITLQSHDLDAYRDFGSMDLTIDVGSATLDLPADVPPNAYLLDIVAKSSAVQGFTHLYFGLRVDPGEASPDSPTLLVSSSGPSGDEALLRGTVVVP